MSDFTLSEEHQELIRIALESHKNCAHEEAQLCFALTLLEVELRMDGYLNEEEIEASRTFISDYILESLILKGIIEPTGITEEGDFYLGLTDAGEEAYDELQNDPRYRREEH